MLRLTSTRRNAWLPAALLAVSVLMASAGLGAEPEDKPKPVTEFLPARTLFYVSFKNPAGSAAYKESALYKIGQDGEMKAFLQDVEREYRRLREQLRAQLPVPPELLEEVLHDEYTVAFTGMRMTEAGQQEPGMFTSIIFKRPPHEAEQEIVKALRKLTHGAVADPQLAFKRGNLSVKHLAIPMGSLCYTFIGQRLVMTWGELAMQDVLNCVAPAEGVPKAPSLAEDPTFKAIMGKVGGPDGMVTAYFNTDLFLGQFGPFMQPRQTAVFEALGAFNVKALVLCSRFEDGGIRDSFYVHAPGARSGILPAKGNPVDLSLLRLVPKDARSFSLTRFDVKGLYSTVMRAVANANPDKFQGMMRRIAEFEQKVGFKIGSDLLGSMGTQWLFYQSPHESVLMVELVDAEKFESCLNGLAKLTEGKAVLRQMQYGGSTIRLLAFTQEPIPVCPCYVVAGKFAVFALYPQTLKRHLSRGGKEGPSILDSEDFRRVTARFLPGPSAGEKNVCHGVSYIDVTTGLTGSYNLLVMASPMLSAAKKLSLRPELLPHPDAIAPHMFGYGGGCLNDDDGILFQCYSPFGISGQILGMVGALSEGVLRSLQTTNPTVAVVLLSILDEQKK